LFLLTIFCGKFLDTASFEEGFVGTNNFQIQRMVKKDTALDVNFFKENGLWKFITKNWSKGISSRL
jgi:hypothetical protein